MAFDSGDGMPEVTTTISEYYATHDVGPVATPAIRAIQSWLVSGPLTREGFDYVEAGLGHLDPEELKGLLLDFVMDFAVACSDDLVLDDHEMECLQTLKRLFRVEEGDFLRYRRHRLHDIVGTQIDLITHDYTVDRVEDLHLANLQHVFGLGFDQLASIAHPDIVDAARSIDHAILRNWHERLAMAQRLQAKHRAIDHHERSKPMFGKKRLMGHEVQAVALQQELDDVQAEYDATEARSESLRNLLDALKGVFAISDVGALSDGMPELVHEVEGEPSRSRRIPSKVRDAVWRRDEGRCVVCGSQELLEFDHIIPFSKGGSNTYRNVQLLCEACNRAKSDQIG